MAPVISIKHFKTPVIYLIHIPGALQLLENIGGAFPPRQYPPLNAIIVNIFCHGFNTFNCYNLGKRKVLRPDLCSNFSMPQSELF